MMGKCHFSRPRTVSLAAAYQYYSDIEFYTTGYGRYYDTIEVLHRTSNTLTARMSSSAKLHRRFRQYLALWMIS
jgi:hypothetical protein